MRARTLLSRLKSLLAGGAGTGGNSTRMPDVTRERLARARKIIARKDGSLEELRRLLEEKDQEIAKLRRASLVSSGVEARVGSFKPENFVWIFGTAKTGSSWLGSLMAEPQEHYGWREPNVGDLFGTHYYRKVEGKYRDRKNEHYRHYWILGEGYRKVWINSIRSFVLEGARARFPEMTDQSYLVAKEPHGSMGAPLLMEALPESRMVFLVRDPRDVAASALAARRKGSWLYERSGRGGEDTLGDVPPDEIVRERSEMYLRDIGRVKAAYEAHEGHKFLVRYEDLRADTPKMMKRIYDALHIAIDEKELSRTVEKHSFENIPEGRRGEGRSRRKATPEGWREDLTPEQVKIVEKITAPLLHEYYGGEATEPGG
ncbi:MAG: sulfotransferase domain-containing protein [Rubrobacteraceae bacterium]